MNRRFLLAALAALVFFLLYLLLFVNVFLSSYVLDHWGSLVREQELAWAILGHLLLLSLSMAYLYPRISGTGEPWLEGLRLGLLVALMVEIVPALFLFHFLELPGGGVLSASAIFVVRDLLAGVVVGLVHGRSLDPPAAG